MSAHRTHLSLPSGCILYPWLAIVAGVSGTMASERWPMRGLVALAVFFGVFFFWQGLLAIDRARIRQALLEKGETPTGMRWKPLGYGFVGGGGRTWRVESTTADGVAYAVWCKIGLLSGIYWSERESDPPGLPSESS